ncbi:DUF3054 domain-containing protein [Corynebacterium auriscanis]|uniref:DUF3054 domain-containing protein n=1 Tax=Corynebacterium auriscanis TaxID=99807 RepID=UPI000B1FF0CD|nr:DUF3054 domain-containing protein [Corynebacterium auriscanis]WJY71899.1 hypothetical protein CAURIC_01090 [Corynebacterium auriscanis]
MDNANSVPDPSTTTAGNSAAAAGHAGTSSNASTTADRAATPHNRARVERGAHPRTSPAPALLMDILGVALFALFARVAHQSEDMPLSVAGWLQTLWPFLIGTALGWLLLAITGKTARATSMGSGVIVWLCTVVAGLAIWGLRHGGVPHWSFMLVASIMGALLLLGWRVITGMRARRAALGVDK